MPSASSTPRRGLRRALCCSRRDDNLVWLWAALLVLFVLPSLGHADITPIDAAGEVVVLPVEGTVEPGLSAFVRRGLDVPDGTAAIVLDIDTFGGRVDAAVQIRDAILASDVPVIAYVDRRAISAGALITLAADQVVFAPGASMGAATPIQLDGDEATPVDEKMTSYMRAEMRATAEATGRRTDLAAAMVDAKLAVEGVVDEGTLLTVSTEEALALGLADGSADSLDDLLTQLGLDDRAQAHPQPTWAESLTRIVTEPTLAGILMSVGMLAIMVELYSPGIGFAGFLGVTALSLVFGGHLIADLAGWEEAVLFILGAFALLVEVFVVPGFGFPGALGLLLIFAAMVLSLVGLPVDVAWNVGIIWAAIQRTILSFAGALLAMVLIARFLPRRILPHGMILDAALAGADGDKEAMSGLSTPDQRALIGQTGTATTPLRPAGQIRLGNDLHDVVARSGWIAAGTPVRVLSVDGVKIVVDEA